MDTRTRRTLPWGLHPVTPLSRPRYVRILGASLVGLLLLGTAFRAVASNTVAGLIGGYADSGNGGIDGGAIAGIAAGSGLAIAAASGVFAGGADDCEERHSNLPERLNQFSAIRLIPTETTLEAGQCRCFFLEVQATEDKKWYSVTHRANSTIELQEQTPCVVKRDGSKNVFCVPIDASKSCDGKSVTVVGTYLPAGQPPMTATARILVRIPQSER